MLKTYTAEQIEVVGEMEVSVVYEKQSYTLPLLVVKGGGPNLCGRNWLSQIKLNWAQIKEVRAVNDLKTLLSKHPKLFAESLGTTKNFTAKLELKGDATPKFFHPRPVPYAMKEKIEAELERLQKAGVIRRVSTSQWATPIVAVPKPDGSLRICGEYKVTLNPALMVDKHSLPTPESLFATLAGGHLFTKIDLRHAYQQVPLDTESQKLVTINTHHGLYQYTRLPFGVASAPSIFQRIMDTILQGMSHVICYLDDVLITGQSKAEHLRTLEAVLERLETEGLTLKRSKCIFMCKQVEYLGHVVNEKGVHTSPDKIRAIQEAPTPKNVRQLRSLLGLVNYYGKFVPNLAALLHPLNQLLQKGVKWHWSLQCKETFKQIKDTVI